MREGLFWIVAGAGFVTLGLVVWVIAWLLAWPIGLVMISVGIVKLWRGMRHA